MTATTDIEVVAKTGLGPDFGRLWLAFSASEVGSAVGLGALPLIAVLMLDASTFGVAMLATASALASAVLAMPMGSQIEFRRKRPVMVAADLARFATLGSIPIAAALGALTFAQLCVVGVVQTSCAIAFGAASGAHLKALVPPELRHLANSRFESTRWAANSVGPAVGGFLISVLGATVTVAVDSASFLLSALGIRRLRSPEPPPPGRAADDHWLRDTSAGWSYILQHPTLRPLLWNSLIFGGCVMLVSPLLAVFMLRDLGFAPWQYGLVLGVSCLGGLVGAMLMPGLARRFGTSQMLLTFGVLRATTLGAIPLAPDGRLGLLVITASEFALLLTAGVFNPLFGTYRMNVTDDSHLARVLTSWSISQKAAQPLFIAAGGLLAVVTSTRVAHAVAALVLMLSIPLLPWRELSRGGRGGAGRRIRP